MPSISQPSPILKTGPTFGEAKALELAPDYVTPREALVHYALGAPGFLGGGADRARAHAAEIMRRNTYRGGFAVATVALRTGDTTAAVRSYQNLSEQYPDSGIPWLQLGALYLARRDVAGAWRLTDELERRLPGWKPSKYGVGRLAAETGEQLERGEAALLEYVAYEPKASDPTRERPPERSEG